VGGQLGFGQVRKNLLFLKKKKQKDFSFIAPGLCCPGPAQENESFLVLFFKKEPLPCLPFLRRA